MLDKELRNWVRERLPGRQKSACSNPRTDLQEKCNLRRDLEEQSDGLGPELVRMCIIIEGRISINYPPFFPHHFNKFEL